MSAAQTLGKGWEQRTGMYLPHEILGVLCSNKPRLISGEIGTTMNRGRGLPQADAEGRVAQSGWERKR